MRTPAVEKLALLTLEVVAVLTACCISSASAAGQLATPGTPPDVVGSFVDILNVGAANILNVGAIAADGSIVYQYAVVGETPLVGRYLSHQCNPDGSWFADYLQYSYDENGNVNGTSPNCKTGYFVDGLYTSTFALTETGTCPLSSTAQTETAYHTFVPGSGLGQLVNRTFCSPLRRGFLDHPIHADRTGLQAGFTLNS